MSVFGDTLKRMRVQAGLPQVEIANRANVSGSFISRAEAGDRYPDRETVRALTEALAPGDDRLYIAAGFIPDWLVQAIEADAASLDQVSALLRAHIRRRSMIER